MGALEQVLQAGYGFVNVHFTAISGRDLDRECCVDWCWKSDLVVLKLVAHRFGICCGGVRCLDV
jgi:hypothetical protein